MAHKMHIREYDSAEDREDKMTSFLNQEDNDDDYMSEENNVEEQEDSDDYCQPDSWEEDYKDNTESEEDTVEKGSLVVPAKPTVEEMDAVYSLFLQEEQAKEESMIEEISAWVAKGHQVRGETLEDHFADMKKQKMEELEKLVADRKVKEEADRAVVRENIAHNLAKSERPPARRREQRPNAKGKLQGLKISDAKPKGRRAVRKEKQEKAKTAITIVAKPATITTESILGDDLPKENEDTEVDVETEPVVERDSQIMALVSEVNKIKEDEKNKVVEDMASWQVVGTVKPKKTVLDVAPRPAWKQQQTTTSDPVEVARRAGFAILAGANKHQSQLTRTRLCNSVIDGTKCPHGTKCRFAHGIDQLTRNECAFGPTCWFCKQTSPGVYRNIPDKHGGGKVCYCWHPEETVASYSSRMGLKTKGASVLTVSEPIKIELKTRDLVVQAPKLAPWANKVSQKQSATVTPDKTSQEDNSHGWTEVSKSRRSRSGEEQVVIRVPKEMAEMAKKATVARGVKNFRIELL